MYSRQTSHTFSVVGKAWEIKAYLRQFQSSNATVQEFLQTANRNCKQPTVVDSNSNSSGPYIRLIK